MSGAERDVSQARAGDQTRHGGPVRGAAFEEPPIISRGQGPH